jgi:hypothetical protein
MADYQTSGLDMGQTLEWYRTSGVGLPQIPSDKQLPVENPDLIALSSRDLGSLLSLFSKNAIERSILRKIVGMPATWFHKDSTSEKPVPTTKQEDALTPTAIIPSYTDYTPWGELKVPTADILLYQLPRNAVPEDIGKLVLSEGFIHEVGHTIVQPAMYVSNHDLKFPDGKIVNGKDAILQFANLAEQHLPISRYASFYRGKDNKFESDNPKYDPRTAISEELCETIAAYFLGFAFCGDDARSRNPFADRPEIKDFVKDFLNAELVRR